MNLGGSFEPQVQMTGGDIRWGGGHLERLHRVSPESTIFDIVSMVSRQGVTRLTVPNSLYAHIVYS